MSIIDEIQEAIKAHGKWKLNLSMAISSGKSEFTVENVKVDNHCQFGKWLHGDTITQDQKNMPEYKKVLAAHADFHKTASTVLDYALQGNQEEAYKILNGEYSDKSTFLINELVSWKMALK